MKYLIRFIRGCVVVAVFLPVCLAAVAADAPKKILFFSKSGGFEHPMIAEKNGQPSKAQVILTELGKKYNFEFTFTKDGSVFTPENIAKYDAFFFYTQGDLLKRGLDGQPPMTPEGKAAFLEAIYNGKGFIGTHSASDTSHSGGLNDSGPGRWQSDEGNLDPYIKMIGGEFIVHGSQQTAHQIVIDKNFPGLSAVPDDFGPMEEWYSLKNFAPDLHVLLVQDTSTMQKTGGNRKAYDRPNYPSTWARLYGKGRVFYTNMGHRDDVWTNPVFQSVLVGGINWSVGNVEADITPNLQKAAPEAGTLPPAP
ncbi:MAG TPA: ThuA domain-containing protein [Verrucomicrobiae bacterium]|nr:ThuA domain-containing protein [Verrucomicrobiae bacterium]